MNVRRVWRLVVLSLFVWMAAVSRTSLAQDSPLRAVSPDTGVVIQGRLDGSTSTFSGLIRLLYTGEGTAEVLLLPSALTDGTRLIERSNVVIEGATVLTAGRPTDIRIAINNVTEPGTYTGEIEFLLSGQSDTLKVPVTATISAVPDVTAVTDSLTMSVIRCTNWLECGLAALFFPGARQQTDWSVLLENRAAQDAAVTSTSLHVRNTASSVRSDALTVTAPAVLPALEISESRVTVDSSRMEPGSYTGSLRLRVDGAASPVAVALQISVRSSPLLPIILVILGVLLGRLVRWVETPAVKGRLAIYGVLQNLRRDVDLLDDSVARSTIVRQIDDLERTSSQSADETQIAAWTEKSQEIALRLQTFRKLANLRGILTRPPYQGKPLVEPVVKQVDDAYAKLLLPGKEALTAAQTILTEIETKLAQPDFRGRGDTDEARIMQAAVDVPLTDTTVQPVPAEPAGVSAWIGRTLRRISGISTGATYYIVRPLLWIVLIVVLGLVGLQSQYVNNGITFGAAGIYDYLALFLWGLTADVASTGLLNLSQLTANRGS